MIGYVGQLVSSISLRNVLTGPVFGNRVGIFFSSDPDGPFTLVEHLHDDDESEHRVTVDQSGGRRGSGLAPGNARSGGRRGSDAEDVPDQRTIASDQLTYELHVYKVSDGALDACGTCLGPWDDIDTTSVLVK